MSDMIINDSVPVDKKWGELIKYKIFIMKLVEFVVAFLLNILPHVVEPVGNMEMHCLVAGPTLMVSMFLMLLYVVDQVQYETEMYFACLQIGVIVISLIYLMSTYRMPAIIYGLFYLELIIAIAIDLYYQKKERGWTF